MGPPDDLSESRVGTIGVPGSFREYTDSPGDGVVDVAMRLVHIHRLAVGIGQGDGRMERHLRKESYQLIQLSIKPILTFGCGLVGCKWLTCSPLRHSPPPFILFCQVHGPPHM